MISHKFLSKIANTFPRLSTVGYEVLKQFWSIQAGFLNYSYPKNEKEASVSYDKVLIYNKNRPFGPKKRICYAPFNNLHFQTNGDVSSCSFNYDFILGNVNNSSIKEIWFGEKAENFRNTLANYNFHKCQSCQNVLDANNYSSFPPLKYDIHSSDTAVYPTQMSFEMSNLCNYECIMCNENFSSLIRKNKTNLPPLKFSYPDSFFDELSEFIPHLQIATFIGGEPLLIKPYFKIWEKILELNKNCQIHIQTNGSYLSPRFLEMLESGQFDIGVSIDGVTKETFEMIRINANYDEVCENVKILKTYLDRGKISMNINFCPLVQNWKELPGMVEYASSLSIPLKIVNVENPRNLSLHHRSASYLKTILDYYSSITFETIHHPNSIITKRNIKAFYDLQLQIKHLISESIRREEYFDNLDSIYRDKFTDRFNELFQTSKLFLNFTEEQRSHISEKLLTAIQNYTSNVNIQKRVLYRIYYMLVFFDHTAESQSSTNLEVAMKILSDAAQEFYLLENESNS